MTTYIGGRLHMQDLPGIINLDGVQIPTLHIDFPTSYWESQFLINGLEAERPPVEDEFKHMMRWYRKVKTISFLSSFAQIQKILRQMTISAEHFKKAMYRMSCISCDTHLSSLERRAISGFKGELLGIDTLKNFKHPSLSGGRSRKVHPWDNQRRGRGRR